MSAGMDVDLIGPDVDALYQAGEDGTLARSRQLGPALPDLGGAGDEPALRRQIRKLCRLVDAARIEKPLTGSAGHELFDLRGRDTQSGRALRLKTVAGALVSAEPNVEFLAQGTLRQTEGPKVCSSPTTAGAV